MSYDAQKKFFETAYRTGTDIWTNKFYQSKILSYISKLKDQSIVLDLGTGRGRFPFTMAEMGMKVIGVDYITELVKINNREVKAKGLEGKVRFIEGDVFDIPIADETIDAVTDFGLLQHLYKEDWQKYGGEISRVLKTNGHVLIVALSKETPKFYDFSPKDSADSEIDKYGAHYHFFTEEEILKIFGNGFEKVDSEVFFPPKESEGFLITLLKKN